MNIFLSRTLINLFFSICFFLLTASVHASSISSIYVFGDSLSDTSSPQNTNGLFWVEYLAPMLGLSYSSSTNFAVSGATTADILNQVSNYQSSTMAADPNALYVLWGGSNDIFQAFQSTTSPNEFLVASNAVSNITNSIDILTTLGAQNIVVPNLPDLGLIPADGTGALTSITMTFNALLGGSLSAYSNTTLIDAFGKNHEILDNPLAYGIVDTTTACQFSVVDCNTAMFWDDVHPTTLIHQIYADQVFNVVSTVPVPAAVWLFGSGLLGLIGIAKRKKSA